MPFPPWEGWRSLLLVCILYKYIESDNYCLTNGMLCCFLFLEAVFTCGQKSKGKDHYRCKSCHLHWPENRKEMINLDFYHKKNKNNN